jgi:methionine transaminase
MIHFEGNIVTKLPQTGTSIFAVMSQMANEHNAVNLSQGFPDFPISDELIELVTHFMKKGYNQYAPMPGVPELRRMLSQMFEQNHGAKYDPDREITITAGATQAIYTAISAFITKGDEVILFEPAYDSYAPSVTVNGGLVKYAQLQYPDYSINWDELPRMISSNTKMIIINSPHNPTGSVIGEEDMKRLENLINGRDIIVLSDEVYEHLIFDGNQHQSVTRFPELASKSIVIGSFGKTFHTTGWKTGFILAPEKITAEFRKVHQFVVFAVNTPIQYAVAEYLKNPDNYTSLGNFYQQKRDFFISAIKESKFKPLPCSGTYFQLLNYSDISDDTEMEMATKLVKQHGIAAVPVSPFYRTQNNNHTLRFCFAKKESTLKEAADILCRI